GSGAPPGAGSGAGGRAARAAAHGSNGPPSAGVSRSQRSTLVSSVATPRNVSRRARQIAVNALLAALIVLLIAFPSHVFNSTLGDNYDEIVGWVRPSQARVLRARRFWSGLPSSVSVGGLALAGAVLYGFLDPRFGLSAASLALVLGLTAALIVMTAVVDVARARYLRRRLGVHSYVRGYPGGLLVAMLLVAFSRVAHFNPGYVFGVFTALNFSGPVDERDDGRAVARASMWAFGLAVAAWFAWEPVSRAALRPHPSFGVLVLDAALATMWVAGVQGLVFGLLPLRFLAGEKVVAWSRRGWAAIYLVGTFAFVHTMLNPGAAARGSRRSILPALLLFVAFGVASVAFWAFFRFRTPASSLPYQPPDEHPERLTA
ncbi:MAG: hypothetical protein JWN46_3823, partial [Acidimicrobiales bacterium]|nr:hypothetical protein [Acidimicrobiales bacterium]